MGRRRRNSVVPFVVLGAAVSIGVVALTASRFGWRKKAEPPPEVETPAEPETLEEPKPEPRFKPAPPRPADTPRWDTPPADYAKAGEVPGRDGNRSRTSAEPSRPALLRLTPKTRLA